MSGRARRWVVVGNVGKEDVSSHIFEIENVVNQFCNAYKLHICRVYSFSCRKSHQVTSLKGFFYGK